MADHMTVISLGWGVQSWGLAAMSALGILPAVDAAIHADTSHERAETYAHAAKWTPWLEERGVRVVTVQAPAPRRDPCCSVTARSMFLPAFSRWLDGRPSGMMRRQCTSEWKIKPIRRWLQSCRDGQQVHTWIGITLDEVGRMSHSHVKYVENHFPFIEMLDRPWTRGMAMRWLRDNNLDIPVKSSCVFCPYHDDGTWREIKLSDNGDWQKALGIDQAIRDKRPGYCCYLHATRQPLQGVDLRSEQDRGQLELWGEECSGHCFL